MEGDEKGDKTMTDIEQEVMEILVAYPPTSDPWAGPIHAVDRARGWETADSSSFVRDMLERDLLSTKSKPESVTDPAAPNAGLWVWVEGEAAKTAGARIKKVGRAAKPYAGQVVITVLMTAVGLAVGAAFNILFGGSNEKD